MTAPTNSPERRWATGVLVLSGAISLGFNTRHAFGSTSLPWPLALGYGAGPVLLAAMQSHVVALQAARGELVGGWRKATTYGLVVGALALSFLGIYDLLRGAVPNPIPVLPFNLPAILTPVVVDLMALAALHELLRPAMVAAELPPVVAPAAAAPGALLATPEPPVLATSGATSGDRSIPRTGDSERQDDPATVASEAADPGDSSPREVAPPTPRRPATAGARKKTGRRTMTEWVEVAGPIFHAEFTRLRRQPTADEFAEAIKKAKLGTVSASTAKNIRAEILDRSPIPALD